jgi:hypothetical protein
MRSATIEPGFPSEIPILRHMTENSNDAALLALAFVEALILEDGHKVQALARMTDPAELGGMFSTVSKILAALLESSLGAAGAVERINGWRQIYLHPEAAAQWLD